MLSSFSYSMCCRLTVRWLLCELVQGLKDKQREDASYMITAPMLYESKHDGSYAAHATQSNLRLVRDKRARCVCVIFDHAFLLGDLNYWLDMQHLPTRILPREKMTPLAGGCCFRISSGTSAST
jgi:hypothetical protein